MKKYVLWLVCALLLSGCGGEEVFETVADEWAAPVMAQPKQITVELPGEAALPAMESDAGRIYLCEDYEICLQTLEAGDLNATIQSICGYSPEELTVVETSQEGAKRYDFVWASAEEAGERLGRAVILDDGSYHYTMTVLRDPDTTETSQTNWNSIFDSFRLG